MTRLEKYRQKRYLSQIILSFFLLILVILFLGTIGLKLLINTSLFIANLSHKNKPIADKTTTEENFILPPEIFDVPNATNSATIKITGKTTPQKKLVFYVNEEIQKEIVPENESFEEEIKLVKGENSLYLVLEDLQNDIKKQSKTYRIIYKDEKPKLEITAPYDQEIVAKGEIQIIGSTDKEVFVKINGLPTVVDAEGKFSYPMKLKEGANKITIEAEDLVGNRETKELTVNYQKEE